MVWSMFSDIKVGFLVSNAIQKFWNETFLISWIRNMAIRLLSPVDFIKWDENLNCIESPEFVYSKIWNNIFIVKNYVFTKWFCWANNKSNNQKWIKLINYYFQPSCVSNYLKHSETRWQRLLLISKRFTRRRASGRSQTLRFKNFCDFYSPL